MAWWNDEEERNRMRERDRDYDYWRGERGERGRDMGQRDFDRGYGYYGYGRREPGWDYERGDYGYGTGRYYGAGGYGRGYDYGRGGYWNYDRDQDAYGRGFGQERDYYGRNYGRTYDRDRERFGRGYERDQEMFGRGYDRDQEMFGRGYERDYDREGTGWWGGWTRETEGPFTGIGPRGYTRSDERVRDDIHERLTQHGRLDASNIQVDVDNGTVTLRGEVDSRWARREAEDLADSVMGVRDVNNHLRVRERQQQWGRTAMMGGMGRGQIREDMTVVGSGGDEIGQVKEVRGNDFLLDRTLARDVYVPFNAVRSTTGDRVMLNVASDQIDNQGWEMPELVDTGTTGGTRTRRTS